MAGSQATSGSKRGIERWGDSDTTGIWAGLGGNRLWSRPESLFSYPQTATYRRFGKGLGYFLTAATGRSKSTEVDSISHWLHPSIPIRFQHDVRDPDNDDLVQSITLDWDRVAAELAMEGPIGVSWNYFSDASPEVNIPFNRCALSVGLATRVGAFDAGTLVSVGRLMPDVIRPIL